MQYVVYTIIFKILVIPVNQLKCCQLAVYVAIELAVYVAIERGRDSNQNKS